MPIHPIGETNRKGTLGSYYAVRDYCGVNPEFGTMADFDRFVSTAHGLGLKVLLDWVANHTARDARWVTERPADWYERDAAGEPVVPNGWDDTAKLNYANRAVWQGQIDAMRFWLAEHGVDGFRCDMAMLVPTAFWQEAAAQLREVKHNLFMLAEAEQADLFRPCVRRLLCVGVPPYRQRHRAGTPPRVGPAQLPLRRPRPLSAFGHAADVHLQSRREFVERQRVPPAGRCGRNHGRADVRAAAVDAARLYGAGVRLRPFVRLLRPRSDGRSPSGALHGAVPAAVSVEAPQPRVAGGRGGAVRSSRSRTTPRIA